MPLFHTATAMFPPHGGQDRLAVQQFDDRIVLVVADGAGGIRGGAEAAQFACDRVMQLARAAQGDPRTWVVRLHAIDQELSAADHGGQTTLVVAEIWNGQVTGASVGDSEAWLAGNRDEHLDLTEHQQRKPLMGSGSSQPRAFGPVEMKRRLLLVASDGLFRFASSPEVLLRFALPDQVFDRKAISGGLDRLPASLTDLVRLPNGELQDDISIAVCVEAAETLP